MSAFNYWSEVLWNLHEEEQRIQQDSPLIECLHDRKIVNSTDVKKPNNYRDYHLQAFEFRYY
jgi:hypothetical protein